MWMPLAEPSYKTRTLAGEESEPEDLDEVYRDSVAQSRFSCLFKASALAAGFPVELLTRKRGSPL
jgi:hypothetical protein